jgi:hypothetical protein
MATAIIKPVRTISGNQEAIRRMPEAITQSFKQGAIVQLTSGYLAVWDGTTYTRGIAGVAIEPGSSLIVAGTPLQKGTFGEVPNQSSAVNIARGAPFNDGKCGICVANSDTVFKGQCGPAQTVTQANVGVEYGLTVDSDGHWYVDTTKSTAGTNTAVKVTEIDPNDNRGVFFQFVGYVQQLQA